MWANKGKGGPGKEKGNSDKGGGGGFWAPLLTVVSFGALWGLSMLYFARQDAQKHKQDPVLLRSMRQKPVNFTEHAKCRMDCR